VVQEVFCTPVPTNGAKASDGVTRFDVQNSGFKPPVPETHYHISTVACRASLVNINRVNGPFSM
jgi:hypothetical protein